MKYITLLLLFAFITSYLAISAQESDVTVKKPTYEAHWAGMDVGTVILMNSNFENDFTNNPYWENDIVNSNSVTVNVFEYKLPIFKQFLGLTTGFGYRNTNISFRDNYELDYNDGEVFAEQINLSSEQEEMSEIKQNWLAVHYLTVPLLLEFATKVGGKKSFYFNAGVVGGVRVGSRTTLKGKYDNGDKFTNVRRAKYNLNPFVLDASFRIGYGAFGLFGSYSLTTMFKENTTVAIHPLRVGITWNWHMSGSDKSEKGEFDFEAIEEEAVEGVDL
ncbi:MAG: outer membrane beta-barrel protein [Crocinitomicaceae bacterium]|tara:strand:- start:2802 stop:3626 length:825 start_codon:yes stop_codon:yes gene_type:complete